MAFFEILGTIQGWTYLVILTFLEIVLGIDNIIFISIISDKLPDELKKKARNIGLSLALIVRIGLLGIVSFIISMKQPLFSVLGFDVSGQSIILLFGGLFLIYKSTIEMHKTVSGNENPEENTKRQTMTKIILQIVLVDLVFSFDSVITAIGMTHNLRNPMIIIYLSVLISVFIMFLYGGKISKFISDYPTIKMISLSFLVTIGVLLVAKAFHHEIPEPYVYFAFVYSLFVEFLNIRMRKNIKKS
jgi:predicted tellurium resistance membrane protein TerC